MSESDLCLKLEEYFREWEIYKEVPCGGRLDIYVKKGVLWVSVEVKKQLSCSLIMQAFRHKPHANYSYIAIPELRNSIDGEEICKKLGIGVLEWETKNCGEPHWNERVHPAFQRKIIPYRVLDRMKKAIAGVQHNTESEFKITVHAICRTLERHNGRYPIKRLFADSHYHYAHSKSATQTITKYCELGKIKEFVIDGSDLILTKHGALLLQN